MDLQSFLESGLIEAYVLGQGTAAERAEVERMAAAHPEVRTEIAAAEQALELYAQANAVAAPAWMKGRILDLIGQESPPAVVREKAPMSAWTWLLLLSALLGLAGLWYLNRENQSLRQQTVACTERTRQMEDLQRQIAFFENRGTRQFALKDSTTTVYAFQNPGICRVAVDVAALPPLPAGQYYQFWAIVEGQPAPRSMGMMQSDAPAGWQNFDCIPGAVAYAVSIENNPNGNAAPTVVKLVGPLG